MRLLPKDSGLGWTPYGWLVYLFFFVLPPFYHHASVAEWGWTGLGVAAFLPLYFWGYWLKGPRKLLPVIGMVILGCAFAKINTGSSVFFVYASSSIAGVGEPRVAYRYLAALLSVIGLESLLLRRPIEHWGWGIVLSALLGASMIHYVQQHRWTERLKLAQEEVEHLAKVAERERIARDLHDLLGHTLSVIVLKAELASRLAASDPARAAVEIREVEQVSREALAQVRAAVAGYRSAGFASELSRVEQTLGTAGILVETSAEPIPLSAAQEGVLVLALREAATNIIRHAQANRCRLRLERTGTCCEMEISDNGRGGASADGGGLNGMRQRVETLGGTFELESSDGTTLRIRLPIPVSGSGTT